MTKDEAIVEFEKQLHSAVVVLDSGFGTHPGESDRIYRKHKEMAEIALSAIRAQQEAESNDPLTPEELQKMNGEPVWVENFKWRDAYWAIVHLDYDFPAAPPHIYAFRRHHGDILYSDEKYCLFYRYKRDIKLMPRYRIQPPEGAEATWIANEDPWTKRLINFRCSHCGRLESKKYTPCPYCGYKMDNGYFSKDKEALC